MKKIILILSLIIFAKNVNAETFYGNYYKVEQLENEQTDEIKIDSYKTYNTYEIIYKDLGYLEENQLYIKDENDYIEEMVDTTKDNINGDEYIIISTLSLKRNTIFFGNIDTNFKISEIEIYYKDKQIEYMVNDENLYPNLNDNDLNTIFENKRSNGNLVLRLNEFYDSKDLKVILYTPENSHSTFKIYLENKVPIEINNSKKHIITFNNEESSIEALYEYKVINRLYKYYDEEKNIKNIYVQNGENLLLDDYKIINIFYKRDKLILSDSLKINTKEQDINSFILYSSNKVITNHNIDYTNNGVYKCEFILNDIKVTKDIIVDIKENNAIEEIISKENIKTINNKTNNNIELNRIIRREKIKPKKTTSKSTITNNTKKTTEINKTTNNIKKITEVNKTKQVKNDTKIIKKIKLNNRIIRMIILIIFIILEIIIIYKKKKR